MCNKDINKNTLARSPTLVLVFAEDTGKVASPDAMLQKPVPFTEQVL